MGDLKKSELWAEVKANIGNRDDLDDRTENVLNFAQEKINRFYPFSEMEEIEDKTTSENTRFVTLDSVPRNIISVRLLDDSMSRKLIYVPRPKFDRLAPYPESYATGRPEFYTFFENKLELYRVPDDEYSLRVRYIKKPTRFTTSSDTTSDYIWKDDIIVALATAYAFRSLARFDLARNWEAEADRMLRAARESDKHFTDFGMGDGLSNGSAPYYQDPFVKRVI